MLPGGLRGGAGHRLDGAACLARVRDPRGRIAAWHHAAVEATGLAAASFELITLQYVCHELPAFATRAVLAEAGFTEVRRQACDPRHWVIVARRHPAESATDKPCSPE